MTHTKYFHFLHARSGFGDRIVDLWAAKTVVSLLDPAAKLYILWDNKGINFGYGNTRYKASLFNIKGCSLAVKKKHKLHMPASYEFDAHHKEAIGKVSLSSARQQIILRDGQEWGNSYASRIHANLDFYGCDNNLSLDQVIQCYQRVARSTQCVWHMNIFIPLDIATRVGIHVRRGDKLVAVEKDYTMSSRTWVTIEKRARQQIDLFIERKQPLFICSEDIPYRNQLVRDIRSRGGDVQVIDLPSRLSSVHGYAALCDFFALTRCQRIVQMTKYSTFSIAAAIAGHKAILNFSPEGGISGNRLYRWQHMLAGLEFKSASE